MTVQRFQAPMNRHPSPGKCAGPTSAVAAHSREVVGRQEEPWSLGQVIDRPSSGIPADLLQSQVDPASGHIAPGMVTKEAPGPWPVAPLDGSGGVWRGTSFSLPRAVPGEERATPPRPPHHLPRRLREIRRSNVRSALPIPHRTCPRFDRQSDSAQQAIAAFRLGWRSRFPRRPLRWSH